jgi:zinc transport system substrate-binding protein
LRTRSTRDHTAALVRLILIFGLALTMVGGLAGCDSGDAESGRATPRVVAAFYPLAEAAARVGGDEVEVENITPAGTEPHDLEPTTDQADAIEDADVVLFVGGDFQPAVEELAERRDDGTAVDLLALAGGPQGNDPHFWLDPEHFATAVDGITAALAEVDPDSASAYRARADAYKEELATLDSEFADGLDRCERKEFVTTHAAFGFLARRYGLEELSISGVQPESEPSPDRLDELARHIESTGATTVFSEPLAESDVAATLARETGIDTGVLNPLEGLTPAEADAGDDYLSVMRANLAALRKALACR